MRPRRGIGAVLAAARSALATVGGFVALLVAVSALLRPAIPRAPRRHADEDVRAAAALRDVRFDPDAPVVLQRDVDYAEGATAAWYPRGESPILAELVAEGRLPPVAERVGPEPLVLEGVEGIGRYGGTWIRVANSPSDVGVVGWRLSGSTFVRWSPMGYPIRPHLAKGWEMADGGRVWTFHLRRGVRWSDGHPFTTADIDYWWNREARYFSDVPPRWMIAGGKVGDVRVIDDYTFALVFPEPHGRLLEALASNVTPYSPRHYLEQYHPTYGDPQLIAAALQARGLSSRRALYRSMGELRNPDMPRMWPWIYRTYRAMPPEQFVRNPYFWAVDPHGNQLPYVDRLHFEIRSPRLIPLSAASGELTMQARHLRHEDYTLLMENRRRHGYQVRHWFNACRSVWTLWPNINRRVFPGDPESAWKARLLADRRFRQALSLAIDRQNIIDALYAGHGEPAQIAPGRESRYHSESLLKSFVDFDPVTANRLLDDLGLTRRDAEGLRTFPDGSRMVWHIYFTDFTGEGPAQFIVDDWGKVGIRAIQRERARPLFNSEKLGLVHDFTVWAGESEFDPFVEPRSFVPTEVESHFAPAYGLWFAHGGIFGPDRVTGGLATPPGSSARKAQELLLAAFGTTDPDGRRAAFARIFDIAAEEVWSISISTPPPQLAVVKDGFRNVPRNVLSGSAYATPANAGIETFFFDVPTQSAGANAQIKREMTTTTPPPDAVDPRTLRSAERPLRRWLGILLPALVLAGLVATGIRHPFIARRLLLMVPTLLLISVVTFTIIQLPPGDFIATRMLELQLTGDTAAIAEVQHLREAFHLEESFARRYARWLGLRWFATLDAGDRGLLQGSLGRSMETQRAVNDMVGDRILLTVLVSLGTILFTWAVALPIGIYSAVRQYSPSDYILTFLGFIGMCIPNFLLAVLLMYWSDRFLGINVTGLFSPQFAAQPEWTWPKVADLLSRIWVPVIVIAVSGTAGMIRVMRGNLLDELRKPYVTTAMAKGVRPFKLLMKYPVRLALNPFISGIGGIFPALISGGAIVSIVLSLPMVGPLLLQGLMTEDIYLAGSMLMVLSALGVMGTLVSDLLLLWLDPRIRMEGGTR